MKVKCDVKYCAWRNVDNFCLRPECPYEPRKKPNDKYAELREKIKREVGDI